VPLVPVGLLGFLLVFFEHLGHANLVDEELLAQLTLTEEQIQGPLTGLEFEEIGIRLTLDVLGLDG